MDRGGSQARVARTYKQVGGRKTGPKFHGLPSLTLTRFVTAPYNPARKPTARVWFGERGMNG